MLSNVGYQVKESQNRLIHVVAKIEFRNKPMGVAVEDKTGPTSLCSPSGKHVTILHSVTLGKG